MSAPEKQSSFRTWLQLLRAPNVFTVPGDPLAGYLLAWGMHLDWLRILAACAASLCFYCAGLLWNDLADLREDAYERPARPLPSGAVPPRAVSTAAGALVFCGLGLCAFGGRMALLLGFSTVAAVAAYNFLLKKIPIVGALNMGACRGLSLLLGTGFGGAISPAAGLAAGVLGLYTAAVTALARQETKKTAAWWVAALPVLACVFGYEQFGSKFREIFFAAFVHNDWPLFAFTETGVTVTWWGMNWIAFRIFFLPAVIIGAMAFYKIAMKHAPLPPQIGDLIRALLFLQAAFCAVATPDLVGIPCGIFLIALWPVSRMVGKRFYAS